MRTRSRAVRLVPARTFLGSLRLLFDLPQPLDQLVLLSLYPLLLLLGVLALLLLVLQLRSGGTEANAQLTSGSGGGGALNTVFLLEFKAFMRLYLSVRS